MAHSRDGMGTECVFWGDAQCERAYTTAQISPSVYNHRYVYIEYILCGTYTYYTTTSQCCDDTLFCPESDRKENVRSGNIYEHIDIYINMYVYAAAADGWMIGSKEVNIYIYCNVWWVRRRI